MPKMQSVTNQRRLDLSVPTKPQPAPDPEPEPEDDDKGSGDDAAGLAAALGGFRNEQYPD